MMKSLSIKQYYLPTLLLVISVYAVLIFSSCNKKENTNIKSDNYYIKYVIKGSGAYGRFSNWIATTPEGTYTNSGYQTAGWNQTYGPVKKGFRCEVQIGNYIGGAPTIEIFVSINNEPFALKLSTTGSSAIYTVN